MKIEIRQELERLGAEVCGEAVSYKGQVVNLDGSGCKYAVITTIEEARGLVENMSYYAGLIKQTERGKKHAKQT